MPTHSHRLMGSDAEIRSRPSGARQNKTGIFILREESDGIALIHLSGFESPSASETPSLMTERREREALAKSRVPYVLILRHLNRPIPRRSSQQHIELSPGFVLSVHWEVGPHPRREPRVGLVSLASNIERPVLAVGSMPRFAAAEMAARYGLPIALIGE